MNRQSLVHTSRRIAILGTLSLILGGVWPLALDLSDWDAGKAFHELPWALFTLAFLYLGPLAYLLYHGLFRVAILYFCDKKALAIEWLRVWNFALVVVMLGMSVPSFITGLFFVGLPALFAAFATLRIAGRLRVHPQPLGEVQMRALGGTTISNFIICVGLVVVVASGFSEWLLLPAALALLFSIVAVYLYASFRNMLRNNKQPTLIYSGWFEAPRSLFVAYAMLLSFPTLGAIFLYTRHPRAEDHPVLAFLFPYALYALLLPIPWLFFACYRYVRQANEKVASRAERNLQALKRLHNAELIAEEKYLRTHQMMTPIEEVAPYQTRWERLTGPPTE